MDAATERQREAREARLGADFGPAASRDEPHWLDSVLKLHMIEPRAIAEHDIGHDVRERRCLADMAFEDRPFRPLLEEDEIARMRCAVIGGEKEEVNRLVELHTSFGCVARLRAIAHQRRS